MTGSVDSAHLTSSWITRVGRDRIEQGIQHLSNYATSTALAPLFRLPSERGTSLCIAMIYEATFSLDPSFSPILCGADNFLETELVVAVIPKLWAKPQCFPHHRLSYGREILTSMHDLSLETNLLAEMSVSPVKIHLSTHTESSNGFELGNTTNTSYTQKRNSPKCRFRLI